MGFGDPINAINQWLRGLLAGLGLASGAIDAVVALIGVVVLASIILVVAILLVWVERKIAARIQDRFGPNRVGPFGLLQPVADIIKLLIKEDITPEGADRVVYNIAPILATASVLLLWAVIPFSPTVFGTDVNVGALYIVAIGGLGTLAIIMAGWSSNNKYALLGAFRTVAQLVSYEVPLVLVLLVPVILAHNMGMNGIVQAQSIWFIVYAPLAGLIFFISSIAEIGRTPFDLLEAESEIVAGFHIEYSGMKFGLFLASELIHAMTISAITATLFFGGWRGPGVEAVPVLGLLYFILKTGILYFITMWVRGTLPRVRIDHMLNFNWKMLTPLALVLLSVTAIVEKVVDQAGASTAVKVGSHLAANLIILLVVVQILRGVAARSRQQLRVFEQKAVARPAPVPVEAPAPAEPPAGDAPPSAEPTAPSSA